MVQQLHYCEILQSSPPNFIKATVALTLVAKRSGGWRSQACLGRSLESHKTDQAIRTRGAVVKQCFMAISYRGLYFLFLLCCRTNHPGLLYITDKYNKPDTIAMLQQNLQVLNLAIVTLQLDNLAICFAHVLMRYGRYYFGHAQHRPWHGASPLPPS